MTKHCMIDWETLATTPRATVLTIGAVLFDPSSDIIHDKLYLRITLEDQEQMGRDQCSDTLAWWAKQKPDIIEEAFKDEDRYSLVDTMDIFTEFVKGCAKFWGHGSIFDIAILEDIYRQLDRKIPWAFWNIRDTRTLFDLVDPEMPQELKHNALEDAMRQSIGVQNVYRKLKMLGVTPKF